MRYLYLLRHGKSNWGNSHTSDFDRQLNPRGISDAHHMGLHMNTLEDEIELILCSSAKRTRQTLDTLESCWKHQPSIVIDESLYGTDRAAVLDRISEIDKSTKSMLVIGHNPWVWELAFELSPHGEVKDRISQKYPTCSLATFVFENKSWNIQDSVANSATFVTPKELLP